MRYDERGAPPGLEDLVSRLWFLEAPRVRRYEKILPLPFVHLIVNLSDPYTVYDRAGRATPVEGAFLSGIHTEYLVIESPLTIRHVGVELMPAGLAAVTDAPAARVAGVVQDALPLVPGLDRVGAGAASGALDRLTTLLESRSPRATDPLVAAALTAIHQDPGRPVGDVAAAVGTSERTLHARFRAATGVSPKTYAQVWRFHALVTRLGGPAAAPDWATLATESGYYDQPHVIHAFRRFCGWTPAEYVRRVAEFGPDAAHFVPLDEVPAPHALP